VTWIFFGLIAVVVYGVRTIQNRRRSPDDLDDTIEAAEAQPLPITASFAVSLLSGSGATRRWRQGFLDLESGLVRWRPRFGVGHGFTDLTGARLVRRRPPAGWELVRVHHLCQILDCRLGDADLRLAVLPEAVPVTLQALRLAGE
jgi:hypothetical protein